MLTFNNFPLLFPSYLSIAFSTLLILHWCCGCMEAHQYIYIYIYILNKRSTFCSQFWCHNLWWNQQNTFQYWFFPSENLLCKFPITLLKNSIVSLIQKCCSIMLSSDVLSDEGTVFKWLFVLCKYEAFWCQFPYILLYHMHIENTHYENFLFYPLLTAMLEW